MVKFWNNVFKFSSPTILLQPGANLRQEAVQNHGRSLDICPSLNTPTKQVYLPSHKYASQHCTTSSLAFLSCVCPLTWLVWAVADFDILDDLEFCKYPVTNDFSVNPYRYRPETTKGSKHLLHAILAITSHFRLRSPTQNAPPTDALHHKNTAVVLYQGALMQTDLYNNGLSLLDTTLALWQLEVCLRADRYELMLM